MKDVYSHTWSSIVVWTKKFLQDDFQFIDWEAHRNTPELPNSDLLGPLAIGIMQDEAGQHQINFSIGISTYGHDASLFRQRAMVNKVYNAMMVGEQIQFYDDFTALQRSVIHMLPGTQIAPMTDITVRPFQYVQGAGLLLPDGQDA